VTWSIGTVLVLAVVVLLWNRAQDLIAGESAGWTSYLLVAALVFGDAVVPILPGETTLSAASVMAANGKLQIGLVILAGAVGAVSGDSAVYWAAKSAKGRIRDWMDRGAQNATAARVLDLLARHGAVVLLFGRYVPGVRFALNVTLGGVVRMPYRRLLFWSGVGGAMWSAFTCASAYLIGTLLAGYPLLSLVVTGSLSTVVIAGVIWVQKAARRHASTVGEPAASS
jgi:membrane protein DedA with SNARE-associated domain